MRRHLMNSYRLEAAAGWLLTVVVLMLSCGTVYLFATLVVDLPRPSAAYAFALTAALVVSVICLKILGNRKKSRQHRDVSEPEDVWEP